eukprot:evm.model.scf_875.3 EVM.evm.TU.scf_875.3   scf_875:33738-39044(+)
MRHWLPGPARRTSRRPMASSQPSPKAAVDFFTLLQQLKTTQRAGWGMRGVNNPESIADHMYRMGMMAMVAGNDSVDMNRCVKMALVHDVAESIVGDITPYDGVSKEEKREREAAAMETIKNMLGVHTSVAEEVGSLWREYESGSSPEALLVKDLDKLEMIQQAHEYEGQQGKDLSEFFESTKGSFKTATGCVC